MISQPAYADQWLDQYGLDRGWVADFYAAHVGVECPDVTDDHVFIAVIKATQRFVFGDAGDEAAGVEPQPATDREVDGFLGPMTIDRMETWLAFQAREWAPEPPKVVDYIWHAGKRIPVEGVRVVTMEEEGGLSIVRDGKRGWRAWGRETGTCLGTIHWGAGPSSHADFKALIRQGYSTWGGIDNDATVYQWMDGGRYRGVHAGAPANRKSQFAWDFANAVYLRNQPFYAEKFGPRPEIVMRFHNRTKRALGMYKGQIVAHLRIAKALAKATGFPLAFPTDAQGRPRYGLIPTDHLFGGQYRGMHSHFHLSKNKWDVAGLEDQIIVLLLTDQTLADEFPELVECFHLHQGFWADWLHARFAEWAWPEIGWDQTA